MKNSKESVERSAFFPKEVAEKTGLSLAFVWKDIRKGGLQSCRAGRRILISARELERYLQEGSRKN